VHPPTLRATARDGSALVLRLHRDDDAPALVEVLADPQVAPWLAGPPEPYTLQDARSWVAGRAAAWEQDRGTEWTWVLQADGEVAGQVALRPRGDGALDVGFVLGHRWWGRGLASAALREAARWALRPRVDGGAGACVLHWRARVGNWASRRVAWASGFRVEGRVRGLLEHRGEPVDGWVGSLRRGDPLRPVVPWLEAPDLELGDLLLRANTPADDERVMQACSHPSTRHWLSDLPDPYTLDEARAYLETAQEQSALAEAVHWAVVTADRPDHLLGQVALSGLGSGLSTSGEIGYWVHPDARRRGVATRAVRVATRHGLLDLQEGGLGLRRVLLRAAEGNLASQGVARAAGFREVGRDRAAARTGAGRVVDHLRFDLLAEEVAAAWAHPSSLR
jgi:RimJ/RimL family protein N-acetyltransferase